jgi:hypothetical protein
LLKKSVGWLAFALLVSSIASAQVLENSNRQDQSLGVPKPLFLKSKSKIPVNLKSPVPPTKGEDGSPLKVTEDADIPRGAVMEALTNPTAAAQIKRFNQAERKRDWYYWHASNVWNYCHYRDKKRNHWYGWKTGEAFHWVLYQGGCFWTHDAIAGRWLYFYKGYWWWPNDKDSGKIQVYMDDGHYHLCDSNGALGQDLGPTGNPMAADEPTLIQGIRDLTPLATEKSVK